MPPKGCTRPGILLVYYAQARNTVYVQDHATYVDYFIDKKK
jgi:hypothetical protein